MLKNMILGLSALAVAGVGYVGVTGSGANAQEPRVICCGECKPGDNCIEKCQVVGVVPKDTKLTCCGHCQKGDNCLEKCGSAKKSCCEVK